MTTWGLLAALTVTVLATPSIAAPSGSAPSPQEQAAFAEGLRLFDSGDAAGAERAWQAGYAIRRDPAFLVRIGEAQEKKGALKDAAKSYEQYLRESPDASDRADIDSRVRRLAPPTPARPAIEVETPGEMGHAGSPPPGAQSGKTPGSIGSATGSATADSTAAPSSLIPLPAPGATAPQAKDDDANEDLRPIVEDLPPRSRLNIAGWTASGATVLLLGIAAFYGASAAENAGDANRLLRYADERTGVPQEYGPRAGQYEALVSDGERNDRFAKGFAVAAGATALAAVVLFVLDGTGEKGRAGGGGHARHAGMKGPHRGGPGALGLALRSMVFGTGARGGATGGTAGLSWTF